MNKTIQARINESLNEIRLGNRGHLNCIRLSSQSKGPHNDMSCQLHEWSKEYQVLSVKNNI